MDNNNIISLMIFAPLLGVAFQAVPRINGRWMALIASLAGSCSAIAIAFALQSQGGGPEAIVGASHPWIGSYAISYDVAVDGINVLLVLLVAIVFPILIAAEWDRKTGRSGMHALLLVLQTAFFGVLCAQDIFVLFFFWALSALPFYFLIGIWGGKNRERAASHTIAASSLGSALVFGAILLVYCSVDPHSFSIHELAGAKLGSRTLSLGGIEFSVAPVAFVLLSLGLALRTPLWPFHGWFTELAKEAPASVFVAFCGVSVPVAAYIFVKISYPLFSETLGESVRWIQVIGALNLVVCGLTSLAQRELRMLMAYLCLSEVGLILLGVGSLSSPGIVGASYQQMVLGLGLAGFGLLIGVIESRAGSDRFMDAQGKRTLGGLASRAPVMTLFSGLLLASLLGFPGLGGFVGHSMLVIGSYSIHPFVVAVIGVALLLSVYCLFNMYKWVFLGNADSATEGFTDLGGREKGYLFPLALALLVVGLYPKPFIEIVRPAMTTLLSMVK